MTDIDGILYPECSRSMTPVCKWCENDIKCGEIMIKERDISLEIQYHGNYAGKYFGIKTVEEVRELVNRFLDLPIEGLEISFKWVERVEE